MYTVIKKEIRITFELILCCLLIKIKTIHPANTKAKKRITFYRRGVKTWNNLPKENVNAKDIKIFRNNLDEAWKENSIKYNHIRLSDS